MIRGRFHNDNMGSLALIGPHKKYVGTDVVGRRRINASKFLGGDEWTADVTSAEARQSHPQLAAKTNHCGAIISGAGPCYLLPESPGETASSHWPT